MRAIFGIVSLAVTLGLVAFLAKQQLGAVGAGASPATGVPAAPAGMNAAQQSQQIQQQVKQSVEAALQTPRELPEDK